MSEDIVETLLKMMTEEQKAELISKLSKTDELRDVNKTKQETKPPKERIASEDFTMKRENHSKNPTKIEVKKRENLFIDDGTEHKNNANKTPDIPLVPRSRPKFQKVEQVCNYCKSPEMVHPQFVREFYVCMRCGGAGARK